MAYDLARVFDAPIRYRSTSDDFGMPPRLFDGPVRIPYHVDTGKVIAGPITENNAAASNTRVVLLNGRTMVPVDVVRVLGSSYEFRSVADLVDGYYVLGIDLDGVYQPVCQGPRFPAVP